MHRMHARGDRARRLRTQRYPPGSSRISVRRVPDSDAQRGLFPAWAAARPESDALSGAGGSPDPTLGSKRECVAHAGRRTGGSGSGLAAVGLAAVQPLAALPPGLHARGGDFDALAGMALLLSPWLTRSSSRR